MELPYSAEVYFALMAEYNDRWMAVVILGWVLSVAVLTGLIFSPILRGLNKSRVTGLFLGLAWIWIGAIHQFGMMAELNFMAPIYGVAWILQGILVIWFSADNDRVHFQFKNNFAGRVATCIALAGAVLYPLAVLAEGFDWMSLPLVATSPEPTLIFTAGILMMAQQRKVQFLFVLPVCGAVVSGLSAFLLMHPLDYTVPVAFCFALFVVLTKNQNDHDLKNQHPLQNSYK